VAREAGSEQDTDRRDKDHRQELKDDVHAEISAAKLFRVLPVPDTEKPKGKQRIENPPLNALADMLGQDGYRQCRKRNGHGQPVPYQRGIVRSEMIIPRSESCQYQSDEKNGIRRESGGIVMREFLTSKQYQPMEADRNKRSIGEHIQEVRDLQEWSGIRKTMVRRILPELRHEQKEKQQYCQDSSSDENGMVLFFLYGVHVRSWIAIAQRMFRTIAHSAVDVPAAIHINSKESAQSGIRRVFMVIRPIVVGPLQVNCYVVADEATRKAIVVDPGDEPDRILDIIKKHGLEISAIVCTHGHFDHVGAVAELKKDTGAPVMLHHDDIAIYNAANTAGSMWGFDVDPQPEPDGWLKEGDTISFGNLTLTVMHTPGHSPGCVCLYGHGVLISGDTLFAGSVGRTDLPGGSYATLKQSFRRLMALPEETNVFAGHGENSTIGHEKRENMFSGEMLS